MWVSEVKTYELSTGGLACRTALPGRFVPSLTEAGAASPLRAEKGDARALKTFFFVCVKYSEHTIHPLTHF